VFVAPGAPAAQGRAALLEMARSMEPMSAVAIEALRTEGSESLACVYGVASWVRGRPANVAARADERFVIVWRKEADGQWRGALEMLGPAPASA
jgi:ketosteroid isomerase-like protein